jgi:hypothetical protein
MRYTEELLMPISLRIPPEKEKIIQRFAKKAGTTKTAVILNAVDEKLGLTKPGNNRFESLPAGYPMRKPVNFGKH